jgi:hypothetical protein
MVGLVHHVEFGKDALLAAVIVFQLGNFGRDTFQLEAGDVLNQTKRLSDRLRSSQLCQGTFIRCRQREMRRGNFRVMAESNYCEPTSASRASALTRQNGKSQMTKMKTLSAAIILSAAVITPVFAQDAGVRGPGSRYGLEQQRGSRGAYNQLNGPSYATARALDDEDKRDIDNFGFSGRDPSVPGGRDASLNGTSN